MKAFTLKVADKNKLGDKTETEYILAESAPNAKALKEKINDSLNDQGGLPTELKNNDAALLKKCRDAAKQLRIFGCDAHETSIGFVRSVIENR